MKEPNSLKHLPPDDRILVGWLNRFSIGLELFAKRIGIRDEEIGKSRVIRDNWKAHEESLSTAVNGLVEAKQAMEQAQRDVDAADARIRLAFENRKAARQEAETIVEETIRRVRGSGLDPGAVDEFLQFVGASMLEVRSPVDPIPDQLDEVRGEARPGGVNIISWRSDQINAEVFFVLQYTVGTIYRGGPVFSDKWSDESTITIPPDDTLLKNGRRSFAHKTGKGANIPVSYRIAAKVGSHRGEFCSPVHLLCQ